MNTDAGPPSPSATPPQGALEVGAQLGDYVILGRLGAGGMGVVYRAEHRETGGVYALKTLPIGADPDDVARFRREGQAQAAVDMHPNVVRVHSLEQVAGRLFLIMDLAEGGDLEDRRRRGPLPVREAAGIARDLARGLAHVHAAGILHRDLKPANVLFNGAGVPMLVDFGLAHVAGSESLTQSGTLLGTPAYMAPEQASPTGRVGPAADVYGLGAVLYSMLTGQPPFTRPSLIAVLDAVLRVAPEPPSRLKPGVDSALEALCLRCLAKSAEDRPPSAEALADALTGWLEGDGGSTASGRLRAGGALLACLAIGVGALAWWLPMGGATIRTSPTRSASRSVAEGLYPGDSRAGPEEEWARIRPLEGLEGYEGTRGWLSAHPKHALAQEAKPKLRRLAKKPLATLKLAGARWAYFLPGGGRRVLAGGADLRLWDLAGGTSRGILPAAGSYGAVHPRGEGYAYAGSQTVLIAKFGGGPPDDSPLPEGPDAKGLAFSPAGDQVFVARSGRGGVLAYGFPPGPGEPSQFAPGYDVRELAFTREGSWLFGIAQSPLQGVVRWPWRGEVDDLPAPHWWRTNVDQGHLISLALSADGRRVAFGTSERRLGWADVETLAKANWCEELPEKARHVSALAWDARGLLHAAGSDTKANSPGQGFRLVWDTTQPAARVEPRGESSPIDLNPDAAGELLLLVDHQRGRVELWGLPPLGE